MRSKDLLQLLIPVVSPHGHLTMLLWACGSIMRQRGTTRRQEHAAEGAHGRGAHGGRRTWWRRSWRSNLSLQGCKETRGRGKD